jgi:hypothetical protein
MDKNVHFIAKEFDLSDVAKALDADLEASMFPVVHSKGRTSN